MTGVACASNVAPSHQCNTQGVTSQPNTIPTATKPAIKRWERITKLRAMRMFSELPDALPEVLRNSRANSGNNTLPSDVTNTGKRDTTSNGTA